MKKNPRIMIYNAKGGVGKTALALHLCLTYDYGLVTNDQLSVAPEALPEDRCRILNPSETLPSFPRSWPLVFDFGGFADPRAKNVLLDCDFLLIPFLPFREGYQKLLNFIEELRGYKADSKILLIANQSRSDQFLSIKNIFFRFYPLIKIFEIKKSQAFSRMCLEKKSISALAKQYPAWRRHFQTVNEQFERVFNHMRR